MLTNYKNIYIGNLFPTKAYSDTSTIESRIEKHLNPEDKEWVINFCYKVLTHEGYKKIKKCLNTTRIDILVDYHETLEKELSVKDEDEFIELITMMYQIRVLAMSLTHREIEKINIEISKLDSNEEKHSAYEVLISNLETNTTNLMQNIINKFNQEVTEKFDITNEQTKQSHLLEQNRLLKYALEDAKDYYMRYKYKENSDLRQEYKNYEIASKQRNYNPSRRNVHREGKYLIPTR